MHGLVLQDPGHLQGSPVLHRCDLYQFFYHFGVEGWLCHFVALVVLVWDGGKLLLHDLTQLLHVLLAVDHHFHQVGGVCAVVKIEQHLAKVWV